MHGGEEPDRPYSLVVLDVDGTLVDSFGWFCGVLNGVADRYRFRRVASDEVDTLRRLGAREILRRLGIPRWKVPFIARHMHALAARDAETLRPFPAIPAMLADLAAMGMPLAILTSNREDVVRRVLGPEAASRIGAWSCGASIFGKAPKLRRLVARAHLPAARVLCIGDEVRDAEAARVVGCAFGAVAWGYTNVRALEALAPEHLFAQPEDITALLREG
ncbi:HAD hydrolase-like protein [Methylobacterium komagatae]